MDKYDYYINGWYCINCKKQICMTLKPTNKDGNIYSMKGLLEYRQNGLCEYCSDKITKEAEE